MVGERIAEARRKRGFTQLELATKAGIDPQHLSKVERGLSDVRVSTLTNIADALGVSVGSLADGDIETSDTIPPSAA